MALSLLGNEKFTCPYAKIVPLYPEITLDQNDEESLLVNERAMSLLIDDRLSH